MPTRRIPGAIAAGAVMLVLVACQATPPPVPGSPVQTTMHRHFALARDLRTFAVAGWLDTLRVTASELAAAEETWGLPPGADPFLGRVRAAARRAAEAPELAAAIPAVAEVSRECGACHLANDVDLGRRFQIVEPLPDGSAVRHMNRLAWTSRLLWDGLVGPSDRTWRAGADALAAVEDLPVPGGGGVTPGEMARAQERLRALGEAALGADTPAGRVGILTDVWLVCAECHGRAGRGPERDLPVSRP